VSAQTIRESWARCRDWLVPAIDDEWTEAEVIGELVEGRAQLWEGDGGAVVTRCFPPDQFHIWLAGGRLMAVLALLPGGIAWGRPLGLKRLTLKGRPGWLRVLATHGFEDRGNGVLERAI
jgi:hypothetical protein